MSHFSCIGLAVDDQQAFAAVLERMIDRAVEEIATKSSLRHVRWSDSSGASVAFHLDGDSISCVTPFFAPSDGITRLKVRTEAPAEDPECLHCGGADCDLLDRDGEMTTRSTVQWLYFAPYREWLAGERRFELETVAFAHSAGFFDGEAAFEAAQATYWGDSKGPGEKPLRFAEVSFMPEGMFAPEGASVGQRATVTFAGRVQRAATLKNGFTGNSFMHARVATLPGAIDVVVDPGAVEGEPVEGRIALVSAWLVGRPVEPPPSPAERSWLKRVLK